VKMCFLFSGIFWGIVLILLGVSIVINIIFGIHIPLFRIICALVLIYLGVRLLIGRSVWKCGNDNVVMTEGTIKADAAGRAYNVVFGKGDVDLRDIQVKDKETRVELSCVFGQSFVRIDPAVPAEIKASSAFGAARFPDGNTVAFGTRVYRTKSYREGAPHLAVNASVVFGEMNIIEEPR